MKVSELIEHLQRNYQPDDEVAYTLWSTDDVDFVLDEWFDEEEHLTPEEKVEVIVQVHHYADCEYGITWRSIAFHISEVLEKRTESAE